MRKGRAPGEHLPPVPGGSFPRDSPGFRRILLDSAVTWAITSPVSSVPRAEEE
jgi:hypothetical protein